MDDNLLKKHELDLYYKWRKKINKKIPSLSKRIFSLRNQFYAGCGFHYSIECSLGSIIRFLNDYNKIPTWFDIILEEVMVEELFNRVRKIELSLRKMNG